MENRNPSLELTDSSTSPGPKLVLSAGTIWLINSCRRRRRCWCWSAGGGRGDSRAIIWKRVVDGRVGEGEERDRVGGGEAGGGEKREMERGEEGEKP